MRIEKINLHIINASFNFVKINDFLQNIDNV